MQYKSCDVFSLSSVQRRGLLVRSLVFRFLSLDDSLFLCWKQYPWRLHLIAAMLIVWACAPLGNRQEIGRLLLISRKKARVKGGRVSSLSISQFFHSLAVAGMLGIGIDRRASHVCGRNRLRAFFRVWLCPLSLPSDFPSSLMAAPSGQIAPPGNRYRCFFPYSVAVGTLLLTFFDSTHISIPFFWLFFRFYFGSSMDLPPDGDGLFSLTMVHIVGILSEDVVAIGRGFCVLSCVRSVVQFVIASLRSSEFPPLPTF